MQAVCWAETQSRAVPKASVVLLAGSGRDASLHSMSVVFFPVFSTACVTCEGGYRERMNCELGFDVLLH